MVFGGAGSSNIAIHYGFTGPSNANSNSCSSGAIAIGEAYRYVRDGYADIMVAGSAAGSFVRTYVQRFYDHPVDEHERRPEHRVQTV